MNWIHDTQHESQLHTFSSRTEISTFHSLHITPKKVSIVINSMPSDKATGTEAISIAILKIAAPVISESSRLINHCIDHSTFPTVCNTARVKPIYRGQTSKDNDESYRPISVLLLLSHYQKVQTRLSSFYE